MDLTQKSELIVNWLEEKNIENIDTIDLRDITVDMDMFIIGTAMNERHAKTTAEFIEEKTKENGIALVGKEGAEQAKWILMNYSDIVLHIFIKSERETYNLEKLWADGKFLNKKPSDER